MGAANAVWDGLVAELVARAQANGAKLTGEGGLLAELTRRVLESALDQMIRRGAHKNVQALEADIRHWVKNWNEDPGRRPCGWPLRLAARGGAFPGLP
ncbi:hypothetical protein OTB20_39605 [Streptomyces sp. H27-H1]|nr:hypothetical protein [Streptomyces sp. H27-H1]MCY0932169.1 hypothetical protein [Streptomyces sp. H27-H1]